MLACCASGAEETIQSGAEVSDWLTDELEDGELLELELLIDAVESTRSIENATETEPQPVSESNKWTLPEWLMLGGSLTASAGFHDNVTLSAFDVQASPLIGAAVTLFADAQVSEKLSLQGFTYFERTTYTDLPDVDDEIVALTSLEARLKTWRNVEPFASASWLFYQQFADASFDENTVDGSLLRLHEITGRVGVEADFFGLETTINSVFARSMILDSTDDYSTAGLELNLGSGRHSLSASVNYRHYDDRSARTGDGLDLNPETRAKLLMLEAEATTEPLNRWLPESLSLELETRLLRNLDLHGSYNSYTRYSLGTSLTHRLWQISQTASVNANYQHYDTRSLTNDVDEKLWRRTLTPSYQITWRPESLPQWEFSGHIEHRWTRSNEPADATAATTVSIVTTRSF